MQPGTRRINITMSIDEREGLRLWSQRESREPRDLARTLIRQELIRQGFLPINANSDTTRQGQSVAVAQPF